MMGSRQGKVWGTTQLSFRLNGIEAHLISVKQGGYCSLHYHHTKWNRFLVVSGQLRVTVRSEDMEDITVLNPGDITDIPPLVNHWFEALEDCQAVEFYWCELDPNDIERNDDQLGGLRSNGT